MTQRVATQDDVINGVKVPKGTLVIIAITAINFDESMWGPDVDEFNPDRWDKLPDTVTNYSYMTFLQGPRNCIGRRFAETEMRLLLVSLIQNFKFDEVVKGRVVERQGMITTRPKGGMFLKLTAL
jgi:cytochrome P450